MLRFRSRGLRFRVLGASFSSFGCCVFEIGCFVLRSPFLSASFSKLPYEDVIFDLETALNTTVPNNAYQKKDGYRFVVDNSGEVTPFDWYNARISLDFKVVLLANGGNIALEDHNGIVNGSYSLLKHFDIKLNGKKVYDCNDTNHAVNIKNLLEYSPSYADKTASNEFFYLDTSRNAEEREFEVSGTNQLAKRRAAYNKGFVLRKALLGGLIYSKYRNTTEQILVFRNVRR